MKKITSTLLTGLVVSTLCAGCGGGNTSSKTSTGGTSHSVTINPGENDVKIDANVDATLWVMTWGGDGETYEDIGHMELAPSDITAINVGMIYGVAKAFNEHYPNVKINLFTKINDGEGDGVGWAQSLENFRNEHGQYPDIYTVKSLPQAVESGIVADLSLYKDDSYYKAFNPSLMNMMNYYGMQAGLPQYALPWGIFINRELAENYRIDAPEPDWTWEEYHEFVTHDAITNSIATDTPIYGAIDANMRTLRTMLIEQQLQEQGYSNGNTYVKFDNAEFKSFLNYLPEQSAASANANGVTDWSWTTFAKNRALTSTEDPWELQVASVTGAGDACISGDWDYYPYPSLSYNGEVIAENGIGSVLDPLAIYNYANDDSNPELSDAEKAKLDVAYKFSAFWCCDNEAWEAKANTQYKYGVDDNNENVYSAAMPDGFPVVSDPELFDYQMELWFSANNHEAYANEDQFRGFHEIIRLWKEEKIYGVSDKAMVRYYYKEGDATPYEILENVIHFGEEAYIGVAITDPSWEATYSSVLSYLNTQANQHFEEAYERIRTSLVGNYGWENNF